MQFGKDTHAESAIVFGFRVLEKILRKPLEALWAEKASSSEIPEIIVGKRGVQDGDKINEKLSRPF